MTLDDDSAILMLPPSPPESRLLPRSLARLDLLRRVFAALRLAILPSGPAADRHSLSTTARISSEMWSMCSTSSMYLWNRFRSAGIMTLPLTMRGLLDAAFFSHQRLLSSITRAP
jgi:hypothetical protein